MKRPAAEGRDRVVADERIDANAALEVPVWPDALHDDRPGQQALEPAGTDSYGAAGVAEFDPVSVVAASTMSSWSGSRGMRAQSDPTADQSGAK